MTKILGIDTGTNSLGWAIVEKTSDGYRLIDKGVNIFQEGVNIEKCIESSKAAERTGYRSIRKGNYRRKLRKIRLLRVLSDNHLCPPLTSTQLSAWRLKKVYPADELFMQWLRTDDERGVNPYAFRHKCLHERLDLTNATDRYILGRALYHLNQRRGFLSNRKDQTSDDESGAVKGGISALSKDMEAAGCSYLGDYFYMLYQRGEKIRKHYTARNEHYLKEFYAICEKQGLDDAIVEKLHKAIFFQRPLKSQKGMVGKCPFEPKKTKCPSSHPLFEEYRMLCFLNNVKVKTPYDAELRPLTEEERAKAMPKFFRKSKDTFVFEDIAKELAPKGQYGYVKKTGDERKDYLFNYPMDTPVSGCPVTARLKDIFGDDWETGIAEVYTLGKGKSQAQIVNDVWHALYFSSDDDHLAQFACERLQLDGDDVKKFCAIRVPSAYAMLSLKAIRKILPYLRRGYIYSHSVMMANLKEVLPAYVWQNPDYREAAIEMVADLCRCDEAERADSNYRRRQAEEPRMTLEKKIGDFLIERYNVEALRLSKLYHPSQLDVYPRVKPNGDGIYQLGSPRTDSVRNPMAMRSLFRLRKLVNRLLQKGMIDEETEVHVEFARELNDANKRKAIYDDNRKKQKERIDAVKSIKELYKKETGKDIEPTDSEVLKYLLWVEQNHVCIYTGNTIGVADFVGADPKYDIEHTIPQSVGGDSTMENLTLCESRFNRDVKRAKIPTELHAQYADILQRIEPWKKNYEKLDAEIRKNRMRCKGATTKEAKDSLLAKRRGLEMQRNYWHGKYKRFIMTSVPEGFSRRQGTDISVISKYARLYLRSLFRHVYTVKGLATSDFRKLWGIQDEYAKKERVNHVHHCIDAIVIACIGLDEYGQLAAYYHDEETYRWNHTPKPHFPKPWPTFVEDLKRVQSEILVYHYTADNVPKHACRYLKDGPVDKETGQPTKIYSHMDAARGALHKETYYGAVKREDDEEVRYVKRIPLDSLANNNVERIVDPTVRSIIEAAIAEKGFSKAMEGPIWMNEEKRIPIKKVRCYYRVKNMPAIRRQRDLSVKEYKRNYYAENSDFYLMALYMGQDADGNVCISTKYVSILDYYKNKKGHHEIVPDKNEGCPLRFTLKKGTLVLLYENAPDEIWKSSQAERSRRLYKVKSFSPSDPRICLIHHEEAREKIEYKGGSFHQGEDIRPGLRIQYTQISKALVQGYDFEIDETGEIKQLR